MYSRVPRQPPRPAGMPSYRRRVTPPPNYSGNAFPQGESLDDVRPRFDGLPTVSNLPVRDIPPSVTQEAVVPESDEGSQSDESKQSESGSAPTVPSDETNAAETLVSGTLLNRAHFPLGHGLGQEEFLLLGLIVLLLHEDRAGSDAGGSGTDNDLLLTLIALGFLLLCG